MFLAALLMILLLAVASACGYSASLLLHLPPHAHEMICAALICFLSGMLGTTLTLLGRAANSQSTLAYAGLFATGFHLVGCLLGAGGVMVTGLAAPVPLLLWMLPMYWVTLTALVIIIVRMIKSHSHLAGK